MVINMIGWLITLGVLLLIGFTRVRLRLQYDEGGFAASVRVGVFVIKLYPRREKEKKERRRPEKIEKKPKEIKEKKRRRLLKVSGGTFRDIINLSKKTLRRASRVFRFELIEIRFASGGGDAAKAAVHYGKLNWIVYTACPVLKSLLRIRKEIIRISLDYTLPKSTYYGKLHMSVSIGRFMIFGFASAASLLRFYLKHRNTTDTSTIEREEYANGQQRQAQAG